MHAPRALQAEVYRRTDHCQPPRNIKHQPIPTTALQYRSTAEKQPNTCLRDTDWSTEGQAPRYKQVYRRADQCQPPCYIKSSAKNYRRATYSSTAEQAKTCLRDTDWSTAEQVNTCPHDSYRSTHEPTDTGLSNVCRRTGQYLPPRYKPSLPTTRPTSTSPRLIQVYRRTGQYLAPGYS